VGACSGIAGNARHLEVLLREEALSPRGVEMNGVLQRGVKKEARAIEELLRSTELFEKDAAQNR